MSKKLNGLEIARDVLLIISTATIIAQTVLTIVYLATQSKEERRYIKFNDEELPI